MLRIQHMSYWPYVSSQIIFKTIHAMGINFMHLTDDSSSVDEVIQPPLE